MPRPLIIAHRGASKEQPENTLKAFQRAIELGADYVELDVHLTNDGVVVCHHDEHVNDLAIAEQDLTSLQRAKPSIPTLTDVAKLSFQSTGLMVELKGENPQLAKAVKQPDSALGLSVAYFGSFSASLMKELALDWPLSQLIGIAETELELAEQVKLQPRYLAINHRLATTDSVRNLRGQGFEVWVWTVDELDCMKTLVSIGVQGIITNDVAATFQIYLL